MTDVDLETGFSPDREYILILVCLAKTEFETAVKYVSDGTHEIYVFSKIPTFLPYLTKLLGQLVHLPKVQIILVNHDMNILVDVILLLLQNSGSDSTAKRKQEYLRKYKENLLSLSGTSTESGPDFHVALPSGHADLPQAFNLAIVQNGDGIDELNYLSEKHVFTQQVLRYIALKHGVRFSVLSGFQALVNDMSSMVSLSNRLFQDSLGVKNIIYKPEGVPVTANISLHQHISLGLDSWSKIMVVARSVPRYNDMRRLLSSDVHICELDDTYDDLFRHLSLIDGGGVGSNVREEEGLQGSTIMAGSGNKPVTNDKIECFTEAKQRLSRFLTIEEPKQVLPVSKEPRVTYEQFIETLAIEKGVVGK